ncbi:MAG: IS256 family transposase [Hyphomicrobiaceae bacterium]
MHENKPIVIPVQGAAGHGGNGAWYHDGHGGVQRERVIRSAIVKVLNTLLDTEAHRLSIDHKSDQGAVHSEFRSAPHERKLFAVVGNNTGTVSIGGSGSFGMAVVERFWDREISVEEALIEMGIADGLGQSIEEITGAAWGARISRAQVSSFVEKAEANIDAWCHRSIKGEYPYVYLDSVALSSVAAKGEQDASLLAAIGVNREGHRDILGVQVHNHADETSWTRFLKHMRRCGLKGVRLVVCGATVGLANGLRECFPQARWQVCTTAFCRQVAGHVSGTRARELSGLVRAIYNAPSLEDAQGRARNVSSQLRGEEFDAAANLVEDGVFDTLSYYAFPKSHWRQIRSASPIERMLDEIDRRYKAVGMLPDVNAAFLLAAARMRRVSGTQWSSKRYLDMQRFEETEIAPV